MDYKSTLLKLPFIFILISFISGCDIDISPEPLRIIGPPEGIQIDLYYDVNFEYEFGASGGDGTYRYRYIQNPESNGELANDFEENPVEMSIEVTDDAKASFILRATPSVPTDIPFDELNSKKLKFGIELTDGKNTVTQDYEFTLKKNKLTFALGSQITEGQVTNSAATRLRTQLESGETRVCQQIKDKTFEPRKTATGEFVYPHVFQVLTQANLAKRTEFFYRVTSSYNDALPERSVNNISHARKGADYLDNINSFVLEPGEATCVGYIDVIDDLILEDDESLKVEFYRAEGGAVDLSSAREALEIKDNEIKPVYEPKNIVRNQGDVVIVPIRLSRPVGYPLNINVSAVADKTTATDQDFVLEPEGGVVTIEPGTVEASYRVRLLNNVTETETTYADKLITLTTDIDKILKVDPYTIEVNQWSNFTQIDTEIVATAENDEDVVDFVVDSDGVHAVLINSTASSDISTKLRAFNRDSSPYQVSQSGDIEFSKIGADIVPKSIVLEASGAVTNIAVILNVNTEFAGVYRGGIDFVVMHLQKERDGYYNLVTARQYGTEGDDIVTGAKLNNNKLYVFGKTNGADFEGSPSFETNNGGNDGFLYAINFPTNSYDWARFIGTSDEDNLVAIDVGNRDIMSLVSTQNSDEDAFVRKLFSTNGLDQREESPVEIKTINDDRAVAIQLDASASGFMVLLDSDAQLDVEGQLTPSLTRDVQLLTYDSENKKGSTLNLATLQEDVAKSLVATPSKQKAIIAGNTFGKFEGNSKRGTSGADAFTAVVDVESATSFQLSHNLQFGTPGNDNIISVKPVSDTKYFVLWKEDFSESGSEVYRISAFSIDGQKLSRDPF